MSAAALPTVPIAEILKNSPTNQRRRNAVIALTVCLALFAIWFAVNHGRVDGPRYQTTPVQRGDITATVSATGILRPVKQVDVGSEVSGVIKAVNVDYNDAVKRGQVLALLDTQQLLALVAQAQAALDSARAGARQADATQNETELNLHRCERLAETQMCSQQDLDQLRAGFLRANAGTAAAAASVSQADANLNAAKTALDKAAILAPIDGIVLNRYVEPGQTVAATFQTPVLFTLAEDLRQMQLQADIDEADVGRVRAGQAATFTVDAYPGQPFAAQVSAVRFSPKTVDGVVTYEAVLAFDNQALLLRPGMTATAEIVTETVHGVLTVANAALRFRPRPELAATAPAIAGPPNARTLWVLDDEMAPPRAVAVLIGATDDAHTELREAALGEGARAVTDHIATPSEQRDSDGAGF